MASFIQLENQLISEVLPTPAPVEKWNPPLSGIIDIFIKANGDWYHEGEPFSRPALVKLFSSILKKEGAAYYLVTPVEKWQIQVEEKPLLVVDFEIENPGIDAVNNKIRFTTSAGDIFSLDESHPIFIETCSVKGDLRPYILVRNNLEALIHRNVFYRLCDQAIEVNGVYGVWSCGTFFKLQ